MVGCCQLGVPGSVGAATCDSMSVPPLRRELIQDLSQSPDLGGRARLFGYHLSSYFFAPVSFFLPFPVFHREISSQDRPGTTIPNSVDPYPPLLCAVPFTRGPLAHRLLATPP